MSSFHAASQEFLAWLEKSGAVLSPKIEVQDLRHQHAGRGVLAVQDIEEGELLFRIPRSSILSVENSVLSKEIPPATFDHLGPWLSLILVMLYEYQNAESSNWASYFKVLPDEFDTLMFWSPEELDELQASAVRSKIGKESADETFRNNLVPVIQECASIFFSGDERATERAAAMGEPSNLQLMHKMGSLIMAYAFDVEPSERNKDVDEEGYTSEDEDEALPKGMVPMADMLNADAERNNARLFYEEHSLSMKALKPIKAGEEIFNDYGPLPRSDLLRRYGYITDNYAQYDVVELPFDLVIAALKQTTVSNLDQRLEYLDEQGVVDTGFDITNSNPFDVNESISPELLVLLEALLLPSDAFERMAAKEKLPKPVGISPTVARLLVSVIRAHAIQYASTLEQDTAELGACPPYSELTGSHRRRGMARAVRMGEKRILKAAEEALAVLAQESGSVNGTAKRSAESASGGLEKRQKGM
ncbi:SET domain-containing protein [Polyplosphaeria fusca]|uniref:SET domain-containing protein n=1 Tax=Polyplosphaeria fusca TaxID=682080 RepID=A0A9P4V1X7_9PLEO|nr:SET domain-containing protein [Polyplosphaeria fusca]